jgi:Ca2+-binding EF-hand superfamily protein
MNGPEGGEMGLSGFCSLPRSRRSLLAIFFIDECDFLAYFPRSMKLILAFCPILLLASCATTPTPVTPEQRFKQADKDGSGKVSRSEATNLIIAEAFAMYDTNDDGVVTEVEFVTSGGTPKNFRKVNKSGNGKVTLAEAQASPLVFNTFVVGFDEADTNKDGQVTLVEYQSYLALRDATVR